MKTLTKHSLNRLAAISGSGCFSKDDKSYTDVVETSENGSEGQ